MSNSIYLGSLQKFEGAAGAFKVALGSRHPLISSPGEYVNPFNAEGTFFQSTRTQRFLKVSDIVKFFASFSIGQISCQQHKGSVWLHPVLPLASLARFIEVMLVGTKLATLIIKVNFKSNIDKAVITVYWLITVEWLIFL